VSLERTDVIVYKITGGMYRVKFQSFMGRSHERKTAYHLSFGIGNHLAMETRRKGRAHASIEMWNMAHDKRVKFLGSEAREVYARDSTVRDWVTAPGGRGYVLTNEEITGYPFESRGPHWPFRHSLPLDKYPQVRMVAVPDGVAIAAWGCTQAEKQLPLLAYIYILLGPKAVHDRYLPELEGNAQCLLTIGTVHDRMICVWGAGPKGAAETMTIWRMGSNELEVKPTPELRFPVVEASTLFSIKEVGRQLILVRQPVLSGAFLDEKVLPVPVGDSVPFAVSPDGRILAMPSPQQDSLLLFDLPSMVEVP
jgi:hypothetical protein